MISHYLYLVSYPQEQEKTPITNSYIKVNEKLQSLFLGAKCFRLEFIFEPLLANILSNQIFTRLDMNPYRHRDANMKIHIHTILINTVIIPGHEHIC